MKNKVVVLMTTYNGERFLDDQINSLINQEAVEVEILVRDDGSSDRTREILNKYSKKGILTWYTGEHLNVAKGFLDLLKNAPNAKYYAFCDQDDVWDKNKLLTAIRRLEKYPENEMSLYYCGLRLVDEKLNFISEHKINTKRDLLATFVSSNIAGCTAVFNRALVDKVNEYSPQYLTMHDSWIYKICLSLGGNIIRDEDVHISYRQHTNNVVGLNTSFRSKFNQGIDYINRPLKPQIVEMYDAYGSEMKKEYKEISQLIINYDRSIIKWINLLFNPKINFKSLGRNLSFRIKVLLLKL